MRGSVALLAQWQHDGDEMLPDIGAMLATVRHHDEREQEEKESELGDKEREELETPGMEVDVDESGDEEEKKQQDTTLRVTTGEFAYLALGFAHECTMVVVDGQQPGGEVARFQRKFQDFDPQEALLITLHGDDGDDGDDAAWQDGAPVLVVFQTADAQVVAADKVDGGVREREAAVIQDMCDDGDGDGDGPEPQPCFVSISVYVAAVLNVTQLKLQGWAAEVDLHTVTFRSAAPLPKDGGADQLAPSRGPGLAWTCHHCTGSNEGAFDRCACRHAFCSPVDLLLSGDEVFCTFVVDETPKVAIVRFGKTKQAVTIVERFSS